MFSPGDEMLCSRPSLVAHNAYDEPLVALYRHWFFSLAAQQGKAHFFARRGLQVNEMLVGSRENEPILRPIGWEITDPKSRTVPRRAYPQSAAKRRTWLRCFCKWSVRRAIATWKLGLILLDRHDPSRLPRLRLCARQNRGQDRNHCER